MVGICKGQILIDIDVEYFTISPLAWQYDPWKFYKGQKCIADFHFWLLIISLKRKNALKDNRIRSVNLNLAVFDALQIGGGPR